MFVAAACLLAGGVLTGAQALQPPTHPAAKPVAKAAAQFKPKLKLPKPPPGPGWTPLGLTVDRSVQEVKRAKLAFNVHPFRGLAWIQATPHPITGYEDALAEVYVTSPGKRADRFGQFDPVNVKMLAFGTIPTTATVHISQLRKDGKVVPFELKLRFSTNPVKPPHPLPCSQPTQATNQCSYSYAPQLTGKVDVRVDNVKIDQVPVDVGPNCHTATPATLTMTADAGFYSVSISPPYVPDGMYLPFFVGGTLHGPVDVPAFSGCQNGGDDLSPVVTAMVAGPDNELAAHQKGPLVPYPPPPPPKH